MKFEIVFKKGLHVVSEIKGVKDLRQFDLTVEEVEKLVTEVPTLLEKILGLRVHINEVI